MKSNSNYDTGFLLSVKRFFDIFFSLMLFAAVASFAAFEARATTFTVINTSDICFFTEPCTGSLRKAIIDANTNPGADTIVFNIPGAGTKTIMVEPGFGLPIIDETAFIDGWSQGGSGYTGPPLIELRGANSSGSIGLDFSSTGNNSTVRGFVINSFNGGVQIFSSGITVQGCYIGTNVSGSSPLANSYGIIIGGDNNVIGGTSTGSRNVISGNTLGGIVIILGSGNRIEGNYIGISALGVSGLGNGINGVRVDGADNIIGGLTSAHRNVISGNFGDDAIVLNGSNNRVQSNYVGTDSTGNLALGNRRWGITIYGDNNLIGDSFSAVGNVISGNGIPGGGHGGGIRLLSGADDNIIRNNFIGVGADGVTIVRNYGDDSGDGIFILSGNNNTIGGTVFIFDIPTGRGNTIANNNGNGVRIENSTGNKVSRNSIYSNLFHGIDLAPLNPTPNDNCDVDTGANNLQNFPVIASAISAGGNTTILGSLNSEQGRSYTIEFFSNTVCEVSGRGEGRTYLGSTTVTTIGQSCSVNFNVTFPTPTVTPGNIISATATDPDGNTSEFSVCHTIIGSTIQFSAASYNIAENGGAATITVTRTADSTTAAAVNYATGDGTATGGQDYAPVSGTLNFAAGETSKTFNVPILDDNFYDGNETVNLTLNGVTGGGTVLGSPAIAVLTITDNESQPSVSITDVTQFEAQSSTTSATFTVSLSVASAQTVSVTYATANGSATAGSDYQATGATLTFSPNQTSKNISVLISGDTTPEPDETYFVNLSNPTNATTADNQGQGTILNDDPCNNSINPNGVNSSAGGGSGIVNVSSPCSWTAVSNAAWITVTGGASGAGNGTVNYSVAANPSAARSGTITIAGQTFTVNQAATMIARKPADFDGDSRTDLSIFRPSNGQWWYQRSSDNLTFAFQFGIPTDRITPGDFDGDGKTDAAFWRPSTGEWFVLRSSNFTFFSAPFGAGGDIPAPADYDADGRSDFAVFRPSTGVWYILQTSGGTSIIQWGANGDVPVAGDYDADGQADIAIFRPADGSWWVNKSGGGTLVTAFGIGTDKPAQGDYTGDGKTDIAVWRPGSGTWYVLRSEDLSFFAVPFGASGDVPAPGDYDGDGKYDFGVFRPTDTNWYVQKSTGGFIIAQFGANGDTPTPAGYIPQ